MAFETEVNTFSAAVDDVIRRSGRPGQEPNAVGWVRQTIRELEAMALFQDSFEEDVLASDADPYLWVLPEGFRQVWTIEFPTILNGRGEPIYPKARRPGRAMRSMEHFYYQSGDTMVIKGAGGQLADPVPMNVAYFTWRRKVPYYPRTITEQQTRDSRASAPAIYLLEEQQWVYQTVDGVDYNSTPELQEEARNLTSNWILFDWFDTVVEGGLAKMYKNTADERSTSTFALFSSMKKTFSVSNGQYSVGGEVS